MIIDYEFRGYDVTAKVEECQDAYGTGDSPTLYDVDLIKVVDSEGNEVDESDMGKFFYEALIEEAISEYCF